MTQAACVNGENYTAKKSKQTVKQPAVHNKCRKFSLQAHCQTAVHFNLISEDLMKTELLQITRYGVAMKGKIMAVRTNGSNSLLPNETIVK